MKKSLTCIFLAIALIAPAFGQAPASIAGMTFRANYATYGVALHNFEILSIDFLADGTYKTRLAMRSFGALAGPFSYQSPGTGTYSYVQTSPTTGTLSFNAVFGLVFSSGSQGQINAGGMFLGPFSLEPTGGTSSSRALINMSVLMPAAQGTPAAFGFVVGGTSPYREILIRAVGPGLAQFGISNYAPNPTYLLNGGTTFGTSSSQPEPGENIAGAARTGWSATTESTATISAEEATAGAFALSPGSNDKADIYLLAPGAYTITVSPSDSSGAGQELIEVYEVE